MHSHGILRLQDEKAVRYWSRTQQSRGHGLDWAFSGRLRNTWHPGPLAGEQVGIPWLCQAYQLGRTSVGIHGEKRIAGAIRRVAREQGRRL